MKNFSFTLDVEPGFYINPHLPKEVFKKLCEVLELRFNPQNQFSTRAFFMEFNQNIPSQAAKHQAAKPHEIANYYPQMEEADKKYFLGWRHNHPIKENVSLENLEKTRILLGYQAYLICRDKNISSRWTDRLEDAQNFNLQDLL